MPTYSRIYLNKYYPLTPIKFFEVNFEQVLAFNMARYLVVFIQTEHDYTGLSKPFSNSRPALLPSTEIFFIDTNSRAFAWLLNKVISFVVNFSISLSI
jgi:hypothetical protein